MLLRVSYRVRAHQIDRFEEIFARRVMPLIERHGLRFKGIWKTVVGNVGEFMELWEFESMSAFERQWGDLMRDPDLQEIFQETGPMVEAEKFSLFEPVPADRPASGPEAYRV